MLAYLHSKGTCDIMNRNITGFRCQKLCLLCFEHQWDQQKKSVKHPRCNILCIYTTNGGNLWLVVIRLCRGYRNKKITFLCTENTMNPESCHQKNIHSSLVSKINIKIVSFASFLLNYDNNEHLQLCNFTVMM